MAGISFVPASAGPAPSASSIYSQDRYSWTSSVYSQDEQFPAPTPDTKPLLVQRADTALSEAPSTTSSRALTTHNAETIKSLGYKPFEYWKGPRPTAYPADFRKQKNDALKPHRLAGANAPRTPVSKSSSSKYDVKPMPHVRVRELKVSDADVEAPPRTPTIKERYRQRQAERAKRRRDLVYGGGDWPGWVPDEKAHMKQRQRQRQHRQWLRGIEEEDLEKRQLTGSPGSPGSAVLDDGIERWWDPRTWRRRIWGFLGVLLILLTAGGIIAAMVLSKDNLDGPAIQSRRSEYHLVQAFAVTGGFRVLSSPP